MRNSSSPLLRRLFKSHQLTLFSMISLTIVGFVIGCGQSYLSTGARSYERGALIASMSPSEEAGHDRYDVIKESGYRDAIDEPLSTFSIDVDTASYANVRRFLRGGTTPPIDAVRLEEMINYFTYDYQEPHPESDHPLRVHTELAQAPWNPDHRLLHIGVQGQRIAQDQLPPSNLVFLLDVSGSMSGPDRLPLLKKALHLLSENLRARDRVSIVVYAGAAGLILPPTPGDQTAQIIEAFESLQAGGSTAGGEGIKLAYDVAREHFIKGGNNRVILATDGDFNVGVSSRGELVRLIEKERESGVYLTVLGFGRGNFNEATMSDLSEKGNGNFAYIDSVLEAQKVLVSEMGGTLFTIAKDVKIQVEFNPQHVSQYRLIGYQSRRLNVRDFHDDQKDAGELGSGHSVTALYEIIPSDPSSREVISGETRLKYQQRVPKNSDEVATIYIRYKRPDQSSSVQLTHTHSRDQGDWRGASRDFRFSSGVTLFGMLLRDSKHILKPGHSRGHDDTSDGSPRDLSLRNVWSLTHELIRDAQGEDPQGYRAELLSLVQRAQTLKLR